MCRNPASRFVYLVRRVHAPAHIHELLEHARPGQAHEVDPVRIQAEGGTPVAHTSDRVAVNGVELYYEIHGEGSPLVMLHGGVNPSDFFGAPLAAMAETHQVIAI